VEGGLAGPENTRAEDRPELAIGDGALGFWKALPQVFGHPQGQRCRVHKTATVLNKLPKSQQPRAKAALQEIWMAASREEAHRRLIVSSSAMKQSIQRLWPV
jgi:transposase-like protein